MRVGLIAPPWVPVPPPAYGGTEAVIDLLARGIQAAGHDVLLFTTGDSTCPVPRRWVLPAAERWRMGAAVVELHHLIHGYAALREWGCDIVHDHTIMGPIYGERFQELPIITTNHGPFNAELAAIYGAIADRVGIIAISHNQRRSAADIPITAVIHHGLDPEAFPVGRGDGGYTAFLGRMAPDKGPRRAALVAREAGVPLKIAAKMREPAEQEYFDERVRPLLGGDVEYIGEVGVEERLDLLGGATALLNPILWPEPFGLVMIEALACGTPVLAFAEGAAPEIVDDGVTGFLCADEADMARRIGDVGSLDRAACRASVEKDFSTERMVAEHLEVYRKLLSGPAGGSGRP